MDRVEIIRTKIKRADKHIGDLSLAISEFLRKKPYTVRSKPHPQLEWGTTFFVEKAQLIDDLIYTTAGDAIHNLRSALDYLACQLVEAAGNTPSSGTGFPIYDPQGFKSQNDMTKFVERKVKGMRPEAITAIERVKPYKGGNDSLWELHQFDIVDKHHFLLATGFASPHVRVQGAFDMPLGGGYPLKEGEDIVTITHKVEPHEKLEFAFQIVVGEVGFFQHKPLLETLSTLFDIVNNLVSDFSPFLV